MTRRLAQFHNLAIGNNLERSVFLGACGTLAILFFVYTFLIGNITFAVVERKETETALRDMRTRLSTLEVEYVSESKAVTLERARAYGLVEVGTQTFASRSGTALGISQR